MATACPAARPKGWRTIRSTGRIFVVNKTFPPPLSVIQVSEQPVLKAAPIATIPLGALGATLPLPPVIAFDVVVQQR